jgi:serine/threonine-protein kinase
MIEETQTQLPEWSAERLDSWKEIASFFRREVRTVQLWEKSEGLPVRRQYHRKLGSVYAYRRELESWWARRSARSAGLVTQLPELTGNPLPSHASAAAASAGSWHPPLSPAEKHGDPGLGRVLVFPLVVVHSRRDGGPLQHIVDRFSGGLYEDLLVELRRSNCDPVCLSPGALPAHGVSTATFLRNTAREFQADFYLTGSVRYAGNQVRVCMQLMRSQDAVCLWTDRFETVLDHVFQSQSEIAHKIVVAFPEYMIRRLARAERSRDATAEPAYHACMMGLHFWKQRTRTDLMKALAYFRDAAMLDPSCADAYAGMADTYVSLSYNHVMPPRQAMEAAKQAVDSAVALAPRSLNVRNAEINFKVNCAWDWAGAERLCCETVHSGCVDSRTLQLYASLMINLGRHDEAIRLSLHAHRLDPLSDSVNSQVSFSYFYAGDYANALSFIDRTIQLRPRFTMGHALLGRTQAERGNWDLAIQSFEQGLALSSGSVFLKALLAYGHAGSGDAEAANEMLDEIESGAGDGCFPAYDVSAVHAKLNQENEALQNIVKAHAMRDMKMPYIQYDPRFTSLRSLPDFQKITSSIFSCTA